jgi:uncharacterized coiled-coil protein SlyX
MKERELFSDVPPYIVSGRQNFVEEKSLKDWKKYKQKLAKLSAFLSIISFIICFSWREYKKQEFQSNFDDRIFLAAKAPNLNFASAELATAHSFIWMSNLNEGNTDLFFHSPQNNLHHWSVFIKQTLQELNETVSEDQSKIDQNLALQSIHRSLITTKFGSEEVIKPEGIEYYPYHFASFLWLWVSAIFATIFLFILNHLTPKK